MILAAALSLLAAQPVTFDELLARVAAARTASVPAQPSTASLPVVRLESTLSSSRSQELFVQTPFELRAATMALSVDYPLLDGGMRATADAITRADAADARAAMTAVSNADFEALLDAFGELYVARAALQRNSEPAADRTSVLLASGQISNATAAAWQERALAARSRQLDAELRKVDAEARLQELLGDDGEIVPVICLECGGQAAALPPSGGVAAALHRVDRARLYVREMEARRKPNVMLSGYVGAGAANSTFAGATSSGAFGIYGVRVQLALPLFDHTSAADVARAELELARAEADRDAALREAKRIAARETRRIDAQRKRVALLVESYEIARKRQESLARLVQAGLRSESDALAAAGDVAERATRLDEAKVEEWKSIQRLRRHAP
jgi:outer membrane protein TolC